MPRPTLLLALCPLLLVAVACGGLIADFEEPPASEPTTASAAPEGPATDATPPANVATPSAAPAADGLPFFPGNAPQPPLEGACAAKIAPSYGEMSRSPIGCTVAVASDPTAPELMRLVMKEGDRGAAERVGDGLVLRCATAQAVLMQATLRCFDGPGRYRIEPGDLVLGGAVSDRACDVSIYGHDGHARGFIGCPYDPDDAANVFANTQPPIGLGHFDLPLSR
jgi:hypothetical protein